MSSARRSICAAFAAGALVACPADARTFRHPGIDCSQADIDRARAMVAGGREPWASAFAALVKCPYSRTFAVVPDYGRKLTPPVCNSTLGHAGRRAHDLALLWKLTDEEMYAIKAIEFLNASSHYETLDPRGSAALDYGKVFLLIEAAELLRDYRNWTKEDRERFSFMLREKFYPVLKNGDPGRFGNQGLFAWRAVLAMAIFLEDERMYDRVWRYLTAQPHRPDDEPFLSGPPVVKPRPVDATAYMETFKVVKRSESIPDYGYDEQLRHYIYASGQCQESSRDQDHVMAGLFMYVAIAEAFWLHGDDLYGALDSRLLSGLEWNLRYNLSDWEPKGFTDDERAATFENGLYYRARHRSGRWRSLSPCPSLRGGIGTAGAPRECAYAHYSVRMGLGEKSTFWLRRSIDVMNGRTGGFETWGKPPSWFYEWSGWGTLVKRRTAWMAGDPPNGIHRLPCRINAKDADVNPARRIEPSYTVASDTAGWRHISVAYRAQTVARIECACDGASPSVADLPANPSGGMADCGTIFVPSGASVIRWKALSGRDGLELIEIKVD